MSYPAPVYSFGRTFQKGFTLVELLIVIAILAILSGIVITVLDPTQSRNRARDGVRAGTLAKLAQTLEAYNAGENAYPADESAFSGSQYIKTWPNDSVIADSPVASYNTDYRYAYDSTNGIGCISVIMGTTTAYFKYVSGYVAGMGGSSALSSRVLRACTSSCTAGAPFSLAGCIAL